MQLFNVFNKYRPYYPNIGGIRNKKNNMSECHLSCSEIYCCHIVVLLKTAYFHKQADENQKQNICSCEKNLYYYHTFLPYFCVPKKGRPYRNQPVPPLLIRTIERLHDKDTLFISLVKISK